MERRGFIALLGGAAVAWPVAVGAQRSGHAFRIGVLWPGASAPAPPRMDAFRRGLRESHLVEGRDFVIDLRYAQEGLQQLPQLAAELVGLKVDVIQASGDLAPLIAQQATAAIPIVAFSDDILGAGLLPVSRDRGETRPASLSFPPNSVRRDLRCLKSSFPESREWLRFGILQPARPK
jgi:putative ABC transport system substrate-binding protein